MNEQNYFTVNEANQKIPWLEAQLTEVASLAKDIERLKLDLDELLRKRTGNGHGDSDQYVMDNHRETGVAVGKIRDLVNEITDSGIILRDPERGLVDFPSSWEGREVYLCWVSGEPYIQFWHEIDSGFVGRQPLV